MKDNLDGFQKLVLTQWTFSISISIGLKSQDPPTLSIWHVVSPKNVIFQMFSYISMCLLKEKILARSPFLRWSIKCFINITKHKKSKH